MGIDFHKLTALAWVPCAALSDPEDGQPTEVGCTVLAPSDFARHAGTLSAYLASAVKVALEQSQAEERGETYDGTARAPKPAEIESMQVIACLTVRKARHGDDVAPCRLVMQETQEDPDKRHLWVGRLSLMDLGVIAGRGISRAMDAARRAAGFRQRPAAAVDDRRDGAEVLPTAGADAGTG